MWGPPYPSVGRRPGASASPFALVGSRAIRAAARPSLSFGRARIKGSLEGPTSRPGGHQSRNGAGTHRREQGYLAAGWVGGIKAPMIQKMGMKIPMMNMIQWPFRIDMIPRVINRITYRRPKRPTETPETANGMVPPMGGVTR
jgi:hypothetical protein